MIAVNSVSYLNALWLLPSFLLALEYLKALKDAFEAFYGKKFTMDEFIRQMADSINGGHTGVWEVFCIQQAQKEELKAKIQESKKYCENKQISMAKDQIIYN